MRNSITTPQDAGIFAEGLGKRYGDLWALRDVDLAVPPGTVLGLLGHNGAGKTTAVRILTTLLRPPRAAPASPATTSWPSGRACARGSAWPARRPPSTSCSPAARTSRWSAASTTSARRTARARADELLERLEPHRRGRPTRADVLRRHAPPPRPGRQPRRHPARAVPRRADDGLDPRSRIELWALLRELVRDGTTMLLTTQYLEEADRLADDIVVLDGGRVVAQGAPAELKARVGGERLEVTLRRRERARGGRGGASAVRQRPALRRRRGVARLAPVEPGVPLARGRARARRRRRRHHRPAPPRGDARRRLPRPHRTCRRPWRSPPDDCPRRQPALRR